MNINKYQKMKNNTLESFNILLNQKLKNYKNENINYFYNSYENNKEKLIKLKNRDIFFEHILNTILWSTLYGFIVMFIYILFHYGFGIKFFTIIFQSISMFIYLISTYMLCKFINKKHVKDMLELSTDISYFENNFIHPFYEEEFLNNFFPKIQTFITDQQFNNLKTSIYEKKFGKKELRIIHDALNNKKSISIGKLNIKELLTSSNITDEKINFFVKN